MTKRTVADNVFLVEGGIAICEDTQAQRLDVIGNIMIHDEKFIEIIKGLIQREDEAFKRGLVAGDQIRGVIQ